MFFIISKLTGFLCHPMSVLVISLALFVLLVRRRPKAAWIIFWIGIAFFLFCATPFGSDLLLLPLERPYEHPAPPAQVKAITVLGGSLELEQSSPGRPEFNLAGDRFYYSLVLARQYPQAIIIYAGGTASLSDDTKTEAPLLKAEAVRLGIAPSRIVADERSRNTRENAVETQRILSRLGVRDVLVVTSASHMRRSLACLRKVGLNPTPYAVDVRNEWHSRPGLSRFAPDARRLGDATAAIREYVGYEAYRAKGYL